MGVKPLAVGCCEEGVASDVIHPPKARPGDRIAVLSPSFAAAGTFPAVHEQAMRRLTEVTGLVPVEYPTTRQIGQCAGQGGGCERRLRRPRSEFSGLTVMGGGGAGDHQRPKWHPWSIARCCRRRLSLVEVDGSH